MKYGNLSIGFGILVIENSIYNGVEITMHDDTSRYLVSGESYNNIGTILVLDKKGSNIIVSPNPIDRQEKRNKILCNSFFNKMLEVETPEEVSIDFFKNPMNYKIFAFEGAFKKASEFITANIKTMDIDKVVDHSRSNEDQMILEYINNEPKEDK